MLSNNWEAVEEYINYILSIVRSDLEIDAVEAITHFLDHSEYEMSFEGLFIEVMSLTITPSIDLIKAFEMGKLLKLNEESVIDSNFWIKFEKYISDRLPDKLS